MHSRIKDNRPKLSEEFKQKRDEDNRSRLDSLPKNRMSMNDYSMSKIVLPKIRDKGLIKHEKSGNLSNKATIIKSQLPNLNNYHKSTHEMLPKERYFSKISVKISASNVLNNLNSNFSGITRNRYLKYKSLLKQNQVGTERDYNQNERRQNLHSSSSSQNMSVQEKMLDKVYGTLEQHKHYL